MHVLGTTTSSKPDSDKIAITMRRRSIVQSCAKRFSVSISINRHPRRLFGGNVEICVMYLSRLYNTYSTWRHAIKYYSG